MATYPTPHSIGHHVYTEGAVGFGGAPTVTYVPALDEAGTSLDVYAIYPGTPGEDYEVGRTPSRIPLFVIGSADTLGTVAARDRVDYNGDLYDVDGAPENFNTGPFGFAPGVRVRLMRTEG